MEKTKVSVIIPTYGGNETIIRSIESALNQSYDNFEIIVVDDNDPDTKAREKTEALMTAFVSNSKVKYIKHDHNKNGAAARNTGFQNSKGEYISLLDDDDVFFPDKLLKQVNFLEAHPEFGGCYCWRRENGVDICGEQEGDLSKSLLDLSFTTTTDALMLRRKCFQELNGFDESYVRHQDFEFMLRFYKAYKIGVVREVLCEIIGNGVNNMPKGKKLYSLKEYFFRQFQEDIDRLNDTDPGYKKRVYAEHFARSFKDLLRYGNFWLAVKTYFMYGYKGGVFFWTVFFHCCMGGLKERLGMKC